MKSKILSMKLLIAFVLISLNTYAGGDSKAQEKILTGVMLGIFLVVIIGLRNLLGSKKKDPPNK